MEFASMSGLNGPVTVILLCRVCYHRLYHIDMQNVRIFGRFFYLEGRRR